MLAKILDHYNGLRFRLRKYLHIDGPDDCWPYRGRLRSDGYARIRYCGRMEYLHRLMWQAMHIATPLPGVEVMHSCDNRACANPKHLSLGTHKENCDDRDRKGRNVNLRGSRHGVAKLTEQQVVEIRRTYAAGELNQYELAERFGVHQALISGIVLGKTWRHVPCGTS